MAIKAILTPYYSKLDKAGNNQWAFTYTRTDCEPWISVDVRSSGGEGNIEIMLRYLHPNDYGFTNWKHVVRNASQAIGIRKFEQMVKDWPYAGSDPAALAKFVKAAIRKKKRELKGANK